MCVRVFGVHRLVEHVCENENGIQILDTQKSERYELYRFHLTAQGAQKLPDILVFG